MIPNRASLQAGIGVEGLGGDRALPGRLIHTPRSLELLAERNGHSIERRRGAPSRRAQAWMWQTLLNGLTFHPNFARELRAGRVHPQGARRAREVHRRPRGHGAGRRRWSRWSRSRSSSSRASWAAAASSSPPRASAAEPASERPAPDPLDQWQGERPRRVLAGDRAGAVEEPRDHHPTPLLARPRSAARATSSTGVQTKPGTRSSEFAIPATSANSVFTGPGQTTVTVTPAWRELGVGGLAEAEHERLRGRVGRVGGHRLEGGGRREVDDRAPPALGHPGRVARLQIEQGLAVEPDHRQQRLAVVAMQVPVLPKPAQLTNTSTASSCDATSAASRSRSSASPRSAAIVSARMPEHRRARPRARPAGPPGGRRGSGCALAGRARGRSQRRCRMRRR